MSKFSVSINDVDYKEDILSFNIIGSESYGFDKSLINCIRRTILSDIPSIAFKTDDNYNRDIHVNENTGSIHNEMLLHRISLLPLYINPINYNNDYLFELKVEHDNTNTFKFVTAEDFNIYPLKNKLKNQIDEYDDGIILDSELKELIMSKNIENYDLKNPLPLKKKEKIFRPFEFKGEKNYCLITELKNTNTEDINQKIDLYGVPSLSTGKDHSRFQAVSLANYTFINDETMLQSAVDEKIALDKIPEEKKQGYARKFELQNGERYFKRDIDNEPYQYNFRIKSLHYNDSGEIFIMALQIVVDKLDNLKLNLLKLLKDQETSVSVEKNGDIIYNLIIYNEGHTIGNLLQSHIVRRCIDENSIIQVCGYKKIHPLENSIKFILSLNPGNKIVKESETNKFQILITFLMDELNVLKEQFKMIIKEADGADLIKGIQS